jgi:predicted RNA methylase
MRDAAAHWRRRPLRAQVADLGAGIGLVVAGALALSLLGLVLATLALLLPPVAGP